ncbi:UNVERIFIED_CONTAM: hypothetical protein K2H54_044293 [Gekko kuhli]
MDETLDVNFKAHFWTCKAFLPSMIACNHGHWLVLRVKQDFLGAINSQSMLQARLQKLNFLSQLLLNCRLQERKALKLLSSVHIMCIQILLLV